VVDVGDDGQDEVVEALSSCPSTAPDAVSGQHAWSPHATSAAIPASPALR
jgi:hypothetical protein